MFGKQNTKPTEPAAVDGWFDLASMARVFDITPQGFAKTVRPLIDPADIRNAGERGRVMIRARGAINAWTEHKASRVAGGDPLLAAGGPSPALERYRTAKARDAEMDLALRERTHVDANEIGGELRRFAGVMRRAIEQVQREYGNDPAEILIEAIRETAAGWQSVIHPNPEKETRDNDTTPAPIHAVDADRVLPAASTRPEKRSDQVQRRKASETETPKNHKVK